MHGLDKKSQPENKNHINMPADTHKKLINGNALFFPSR
jgi:hypothetical protein